MRKYTNLVLSYFVHRFLGFNLSLLAKVLQVVVKTWSFLSSVLKIKKTSKSRKATKSIEELSKKSSMLLLDNILKVAQLKTSL